MTSTDGSDPSKLSRAQATLLADVATRFYLDDQSKMEIASDLRLSRFKVARLLRQARETGVVTITIDRLAGSDPELSEQLKAHLDLTDVLIVGDRPDVQDEREALGAAAADYLKRRIRPGDRVGFAWGRTLLPIAARLGDVPPAEFVQLTGVVGNDPAKSPIAILSRISTVSGLTCKALIAPLFCSSAQSAESQRAEPGVAEILDLYDGLDIAVLSVGSWNPRVTTLDQHLTPEDIRTLDALGTVADFSGFFFDDRGRYVDTSLNDRRISISIEQLAATPKIIAVAGQIEKARAIHAVCMSGLPTCLVTTESIGKRLLQLPSVGQTDPSRG